jgi:c-di-GMP-binding flagellar brake protein YcgR
MTVVPVRRVERRQRYRAQTEIEVTWSLGADSECTNPGTIVDLSAMGARLVTEECPQVGESVTIRLQTLHPPIELECPATVVRVADISVPGQYIWAVVFDDLDLPQQARISRFVLLEAARTRGSRPLDELAAQRAS